MIKAIGMIEFKTTATGITAADAMVKTSDVEIVEAQTVCPGKYIAIITGDLSAVKAAVDAAVTTYEDKCIDSFVLGNPHEMCIRDRARPIQHLDSVEKDSVHSQSQAVQVKVLQVQAPLPREDAA